MKPSTFIFPLLPLLCPLIAAVSEVNIPLLPLNLNANDTSNPMVQAAAEALPSQSPPDANDPPFSVPHWTWANFQLKDSQQQRRWAPEIVLQFLDLANQSRDAEHPGDQWDAIPNQRWEFNWTREAGGQDLQYWIEPIDIFTPARELCWYDISATLGLYKRFVDDSRTRQLAWPATLFDYDVNPYARRAEAMGGLEGLDEEKSEIGQDVHVN